VRRAEPGGVVAVALPGAQLQDRARAELQHRHGRGLAVGLEDLQHPDLRSDQTSGMAGDLDRAFGPAVARGCGEKETIRGGGGVIQGRSQTRVVIRSIWYRTGMKTPMPLTTEQVSVVTADPDEPIRLIDPASQREYVLLRAEIYEAALQTP
jgi:hypothetical protein